MKKIMLLFSFLLVTMFTTAQTDGITYQAVIIDNNPQEIPGVDIPANNLPNVPLTVQFSILDSGNTLEYQETHETNTDPYGMINLVIGQGTETGGSNGAFNEIYWSDDKYLRVEIDLFDGNGLVEFSFQELTYIPYVKHREIVATSTLDVDGATNLNNNLTVDGETNLNSNLTVLNQSPTYLTGDLTVDGLVAFDGPLEVGGDTQLYADLTVEGNTILNGTLDVIGQANFNDSNFQNITVAQNSNLNVLNATGITTLGSSLSVSGITDLNDALTVNSTSDFNGRVVIDADLTGGQNASTAYPLEVRGSNQGIWIDVDGGRNASKNFITFSDNAGQHGAVEGQTLNELQNSFRYIWDAAQALAEEAFVVAEGVACAAQIDLGEAAVMAFQGLNAYAQLIELVVNAENNVGVSFKTGGADYAEWLPKYNLKETFYPGEIVGVFGGYISKNTKNADHIMVISTNPIVLGNTPKNNNTNGFEKVAFLGQVPVRIIGNVGIGDYILPSGKNDGIGIAQSINKMSSEDYKHIIGVAWEASESTSANMINVAIGINTNDISAKVAENEKEINQLKQQMEAILKRLDGDNAVTANEEQTPKVSLSNYIVEPSVTVNANSLRDYEPLVKISQEEFNQFLKDYGYIFEKRMAPLRAHFNKAGVDLSKFPEVQKLVENPIEVLRDMQSGKYLPSLWKSLEKRYPKAFTK